MRKQRNILLGVSIVVLPLLAISLAFLERSTQRAVAESEGWVSHTLDVAREFQITMTLLDEAETGQRGFLLTGRDMYLAPYMKARDEVETHLMRVRELTVDNPSQQARVAMLTPIVVSKLAELARTVSEARSKRRDEALRIVETDEGQQLMDAIRTGVAAGIVEEEQLLSGREMQFASSVRTRSLLVGGLSVLVLFAIAIAGALLLRLDRVRTLVRVCSWSKAVEYQGDWITFEEYLLRRFNLNVTHGISPAEATRIIQEGFDPRRI